MTGNPGGQTRLRHWPTLAAAVFLVLLGVLLVSLGQADDSPGLGGLGLLTALIGVVMAVRHLRAR